jgi:V/A-type H+-transporting ATPase subunit D
MAKIKHTKTELKAQRDALARFRRYLPTLELKKQQLQLEMRRMQTALEQKEQELARLLDGLASWRRLFAEDPGLAGALRIGRLQTGEANIAGVPIPLLQDVTFERRPVDLFLTPPWVDDALALLEQVARLRLEADTIREGIRLLAEELRVTSQRVNLFEKVKIPEAAENIRVIRIFLGDMDTAAVARAKIAKTKLAEALAS